MTQLFLKIYDALSRHRPWVAGAVCVLALVCGVLALRMDYDEDIAAFMPLDEETRKYSEVFGNLGGQNQIAVIFKGKPEDPVPVERAMDGWVRNLQIRVDESAMLDVMRQLWQDYPMLLTEDDYQRLDSLLADDTYLAAQMERNKQLLMLPTGSLLAQGLPEV